MIIRTSKVNNYTAICNYPLQDKNLSLKAKGLIAYMLSLPDDWEFSINGLSSTLKEGNDAIKTTLKELENNRYLVRNQIRNEQGKFNKSDYTLYEKPLTDKPLVGNPSTENSIQQNTNIQSTDIQNTKEQNKKNIIKENFNKFWQVYPKRKDKEKTKKWFEKNNPSEELMNKILSSLEVFKKTKDWNKDNGQYIPYPTTWLNGKRWEDEVYEDNIEMTEEEENRMLQEEWERRKKERDNRRNQTSN